MVAAPVDLALRGPAVVVAAVPEGRVGVEVSVVAAQVAVLSSESAAFQISWLLHLPWVGLVDGCSVSADAWEGHSLYLLWYFVSAAWAALGYFYCTVCTLYLSVSSLSPTSVGSLASS